MIEQVIKCDGCNEKVTLNEDYNSRSSDLIGWKVLQISIETREEEGKKSTSSKKLDFCPSCRHYRVSLDE